MEPQLIYYSVIMIVLVACSAYFSATETAFSSLNKTRLKALAEKGSKKAALTHKLAEDYDKLISTILIGNNIVNIAAASIGTMLFNLLIHEPALAATVSTAVVTVVVLIFGEISPKTIAKDSPERFAMFSAPLIRVLVVLLTPVNWLLGLFQKYVSRLFRSKEDTKMSQEELLLLVEEVQQEGAIDDDEGDLLRNAIEFTDRNAEDILTHRVDLEAVDVTDSKEEIAQKFTDTRFSRLLVYEESIDKVVGVVHVKDFFTPNGVTNQSLTEILTEPIYVQKSVKIDDLLKLLQGAKTHLAVVVDEYGGTLGIVTMEDIFEELVGDIWDEHDEVVEEYTMLDENSHRVDCSVNVEDFSDYYDLPIETERNSVGGWVMEQLGKIPEVGDFFDYEPLHVTVTETDGNRVTFITVVRDEPLNKEED